MEKNIKDIKNQSIREKGLVLRTKHIELIILTPNLTIKEYKEIKKDFIFVIVYIAIFILMVASDSLMMFTLTWLTLVLLHSLLAVNIYKTRIANQQ